MPDGKTHSAITILVASPLSIYAVRLAYLAASAAIPTLLMGFTPTGNLIWGAAGLGVADTLHAIADVTIKERRKKQK